MSWIDLSNQRLARVAVKEETCGLARARMRRRRTAVQDEHEDRPLHGLPETLSPSRSPARGAPLAPVPRPVGQPLSARRATARSARGRRRSAGARARAQQTVVWSALLVEDVEREEATLVHDDDVAAVRVLLQDVPASSRDPRRRRRVARTRACTVGATSSRSGSSSSVVDERLELAVRLRAVVRRARPVAASPPVSANPGLTLTTSGVSSQRYQSSQNGSSQLSGRGRLVPVAGGAAGASRRRRRGRTNSATARSRRLRTRGVGEQRTRELEVERAGLGERRDGKPFELALEAEHSSGLTLGRHEPTAATRALRRSTPRAPPRGSACRRAASSCSRPAGRRARRRRRPRSTIRPSFMTATSCDSVRISARLCVTKRSPMFELALQLGEHVDDRGLHGHVERGRDLVADQELRLGDERASDRDPLALAARQLVRIAVEAASSRAGRDRATRAHDHVPPSPPKRRSAGAAAR